MKKSVKLLVTLLLTVFLSASKTEAQVHCLTASQIRNIALAYDSLDECREITDSLQVQVSNALQAISAGDSVQTNLHEQLLKYGQIENERVLQLEFEQNVSSTYRRKYRLWKIVAFVAIGLTVYQGVK